MSQEHIKADLAKLALTLCMDRVRNNRLPGTPEMMNSICIQLEWLVSYFEGKNSARNLLNDLTFGHYAVRELDPSDAELITALTRAYYAVTQTIKGLKLDLNVLNLGSQSAT